MKAVFEALLSKARPPASPDSICQGLRQPGTCPLLAVASEERSLSGCRFGAESELVSLWALPRCLLRFLPHRKRLRRAWMLTFSGARRKIASPALLPRLTL